MQGYIDKLRMEGFDVASFVEPKDAIAFLQGNPAVDLAIVDLIMRFSPEESVDDTHLAGVQFSKTLRELLGTKMPIIILTVVTDPEILTRARLYANLVLNKPVPPSELVKYVKESLK
jgi:CheY-like chemotaxis protein